MKTNILVPTDFSECANHAFDAACLFAEKLNGKIHIYHSADIPNDWEDLPVETKYRDGVNKSIAIAARDKMKRMQESANAKGIETEIHYTGGRFLKNIEEVLVKISFDLIIMGSHGASGKQEWFIGSNTQKVLRKVHTNVLVVKEPILKLDFQNVLYTSNLHIEDQKSFKLFLKFLRPFNVGMVHIMAVDTSGYFNQPSFVMKDALEDFKAISNEFECNTHFYPDYSVESGIRHFAEDLKIDLIAISNHHKRKLKRILFGSNVEMLVNHSAVPVLSIDY